ncbi:MAG: superoxide dismutase [Ni] [Candidatus Rifleibacteriota bacterium]
MKNTILTVAFLLIIGMSQAFAHCQVPCGIYTDDLRFSVMNEHVTTISKSMKQIIELGKAGQPNYNQIVRWTTTKDFHADDIIDICSQYFLCQRLKPSEKETNKAGYLNKLELVHKIMVTAMKCKQTTELENAKKLGKLIEEFNLAYFNKKHKHKH